MKDFFSSKRVESGRSDRPCRMCAKVIPRGTPHISISQCAAGQLLGYRLHCECAELAGVMPRSTEVATFAAATTSAPATNERIFLDHG